MIRNVLGSLLGLIGATVAVWSPFRVWYEGRHGRDYRLADLFSSAGVTDAKGALLASFVMPFVLAALLTLTAILLRSRLLMALAGVIVLGFAVLWMVRQGQAAGSLSVGGDGGGLGDGVANAFGGGALLILAAFVMRGRPARRRRGTSPPRTARTPPPTPRTRRTLRTRRAIRTRRAGRTPGHLVPAGLGPGRPGDRAVAPATPEPGAAVVHRFCAARRFSAARRRPGRVGAGRRGSRRT